MRRSVSWFFSLFLAAAVTAGVRLDCKLAAESQANDIERLQSQGPLIVSAINLFFADERRYPSTLDEITPEYLSTMPEADVVGWQYAHSSTGFALWIHLPQARLEFDSRQRQWTVDL